MSGATFQFVVQAEQLGTAHVVQTAKDVLSDQEEFLFINGDDLYGPKNIAQLITATGITILSKKVKDPEKYGILETDEQGHLVKMVEKPSQPVGNITSIGCMKLSSRVFALFDQLQKTERGELELSDTLNLLVKETSVQVLEGADYWLPVGYPWHILEATEVLAPLIEDKREGTVEENVVMHGKVSLPKSSTIKSGTYIEGNVVVGENSVIGPNAYLRDNVVIGSNCKVGFSVELKNSVIGNKTQVPHLSYIGDSVIGENVNFAGGSLAANFRHDMKTVKTPIKTEMVDTGRIKFGTVIGDNVMLGAGTIIYPGRKIWPNKITLPGQVIDKDITE